MLVFELKIKNFPVQETMLVSPENFYIFFKYHFFLVHFVYTFHFRHLEF